MKEKPFDLYGRTNYYGDEWRHLGSFTSKQGAYKRRDSFHKKQSSDHRIIEKYLICKNGEDVAYYSFGWWDVPKKYDIC